MIHSTTATKAAASLLIFLYVPIVYWLITRFSLNTALVFIVTVIILKVFVSNNLSIKIKFGLAIIASLYLLISYTLQSIGLTLILPVFINLILLIIFATSYYNDCSIIWSIANRQQKDLPAAAKKYCDRLTLIWCLFFIINGTMSLFTVWYGNLELWALYNGLLSYLLIGTLMLIEYIFRRKFIARLKASALSIFLLPTCCLAIAYPSLTFAIPSNNIATVSIAEISELLVENKVFRANFKQTRTIQQLAKPIISHGTVLADRQSGVYWSTLKPITNELLFTNQGLWRRNAEQNANFVKVKSDRNIDGFIKVMLGIFSGELQSFIKAFDIEVAGDKISWVLKLKPNRAAIAQYIQMIEIKGTDSIQQLLIKDTNKNTSLIEFELISNNSLTDQELETFNNAQ